MNRDMPPSLSHGVNSSSFETNLDSGSVSSALEASDAMTDNVSSAPSEEVSVKY